jgi:hypothetical protein
VTKQNKILAVVGIIALFAGLIWYTTGAMTSKYKFDPKKYFLAAFDEDFDRMHFKYPHEAKMKHESDFKTGWVAEAAQWFSTRVPDAKGLQDIAHIKFRRRIDNQSAQVTNEWIIYNPRTDEHFYRTWGTSR